MISKATFLGVPTPAATMPISYQYRMPTVPPGTAGPLFQRSVEPSGFIHKKSALPVPRVSIVLIINAYVVSRVLFNFRVSTLYLTLNIKTDFKKLVLPSPFRSWKRVRHLVPWPFTPAIEGQRLAFLFHAFGTMTVEGVGDVNLT